jgi:hypothetical protein
VCACSLRSAGCIQYGVLEVEASFDMPTAGGGFYFTCVRACGCTRIRPSVVDRADAPRAAPPTVVRCAQCDVHCIWQRGRRVE